MVSLVIVSHSEKIGKGIKELALQMAPDVKIEIAGGTGDGRIGTDCLNIMNAINNAYSDDGVLILFDLGSALMNSEMALDFMENIDKSKVKIAKCAIVEGAIAGAVEASIGKTIDEILEALDSYRINK